GATMAAYRVPLGGFTPVALPTMTVTLAVADPFALVAVNVYVADAVRLTLWLEPVTTPMPWSNDTLVPSRTDHDSIVDPPPVGSLAGLAVKLSIVGTAPFASVAAPASVVEPPSFIAASGDTLPSGPTAGVSLSLLEHAEAIERRESA